MLQAVREKYRLPEQFLLTVGTLEPRKNLPFLINVFHRLRQQYAMRPGVQPELGLVVAGRKGWKYQEIYQCLDSAGQNVIRTEFIPREDLVALYSMASAFVLPSLYEGFGFPPLEAMACGCPVVVSNRGALPEVVGDAGMLLDLDNIGLWVQTLQSILDSPALSQSLVERGLQRVRRFSWKTAASETIDLYSQVATGTALRRAESMHI